MGRSLALKVSTSQGSMWFWTSSYMKSAPAMLPVVASDQRDMKRLSSRKASMSRMVRPIWRERKLDALMAPAETPHTLEKSYSPRSWSTSSTPAVNRPLNPPPSSTSAGTLVFSVGMVAPLVRVFPGTLSHDRSVRSECGALCLVFMQNPIALHLSKEAKRGFSVFAR